MQRYVEPLPGHYDATDPFGGMGTPPFRSHPHRGSDWNGVPEGTEFQIIADGIVVINQWSDVLGNVLGVQHDDGMFFSYCHQVEPNSHPVGSRVSIGTPGGKVGNTGSASNGAHLHMGAGPTIDAIWGIAPLVDSYAYIVQHATAPTDNGIMPFPQEEEEMSIVLLRDKDTGLVYARDLTAHAPAPRLTLIGKPGSPSVAWTAFGLDTLPTKITDVAGKDMQAIIDFYGVAPVSKNEFATYTKHQPPIKGLASI